jgi:hypothetical protein
MTFEEYCASVAREHYGVDETASVLAAAGELLKKAQEYAKAKLLWEGDMTVGPRFAALPNGEYDNALMIAWKQANNGTTYIVSEIELPWLR